MLVTAASLALVVLVRRQDPVFALVIAWALGGIAFRHLRSLPPLPQLGGVALAGAAIILLAALMHLAVRHGTPATRAKTG